ncbi:hypothetical protein Gohar_011252 [Gossypium harknessii]|uniref:Mitogen-activated protein kinase-binding protein 1 n=1 Tax=Gossypium harknessii TaxID=34285 RepID=A0A7J9GTK5_9ROSI|nr:hypothetical protein [Gossypium harknessii]
MAISSDGKYMAVGDCEGNLHIYDLHNSDYTCIKDSHDAEILSLSFSVSSTKDIDSGGNDNHYLLASGGRDRIIHLYDVKRNFEVIGSIDDHSAAVTSVKLVCNGCKILSCSADRSLVFRDVCLTDNRCKVSRRHHQMASNGTVYDMSIDPEMEAVVTAGQDKKINIFDMASGKLIRSFKQNKDFGDPIKVTMDPSGSYFVCSFSNKSMCVYDFMTGEMIAQAVGHGEVVTGVIFLPDCKHIVSVGGDGCIFVWKLPSRLASRMLQKVKEKSLSLSPRTICMPAAFNQTINDGEGNKSCRIDLKDSLLAERSSQLKQRANYHGWDSQETYAFKLSISRLPKWAQDKVTRSDFVQRNLEFTSPQQMQEEPKISSRLISSGGDHGSLCHEHQNPSGPWSGGNSSCLSSLHSSSNVTKSESSASPDEIVSSSAVEDHWFTVYNVRLDLLNSPEVQNLKDIQMPVSSPKLVQDLAEMPSESEKSLGHRVHFIDVEPSTMDVATFHIKSEGSDLFKEHFGNLSAILKVEKRQSSTRRRYSSQYFVRRDYLVGCKRLFNPSSQKNESATNVSLEEVAGSIDQGLNSTKCSLTQSYALSYDEKDEEDSSTIDEESEVGEKIRACREALLSLDIATENVFQLFTKLGTEYPMEEGSSGCRAQLYDEATELLPKIAEKINAVAKGLQKNTTGNSGSSASKIEGDSTFGPMLGTLAESLSQRVVEIVKQNLSSV